MLESKVGTPINGLSCPTTRPGAYLAVHCGPVRYHPPGLLADLLCPWTVVEQLLRTFSRHNSCFVDDTPYHSAAADPTVSLDAHRAVGQISYVLVPVLLVSMLLLANYRLRSVPEEVYHLQTYVLYLQFSLAALFAISFILAMIYRKEAEVHARFMICTALTLIDPVFARAFFWMDPTTVEYHQYLTYGLTDLLFLLLILMERRNSRGRWVFPSMLVVFVLIQIPALLWLTDWPVWQSVASWFRTLPLT
jgi:hypothetical protein